MHLRIPNHDFTERSSGYTDISGLPLHSSVQLKKSDDMIPLKDTDHYDTLDEETDEVDPVYEFVDYSQ